MPQFSQKRKHPAKKYTWDVFISYNQRERFWVRQVVDQWRDLGLKVFFDEDSGIPGETVVALIRRGLEGSRYVVWMITRASLASEWVDLEVDLSRIDDPAARRRRLIPVLLEELSDQELKPIRHLNYVKLYDSAIREKEYRRLVRSLAEVIPDTTSAPPFDLLKGPLNSHSKLTEFARQTTPLNPRYTFPRFVVGNNNQLASAAARGG